MRVQALVASLFGRTLHGNRHLGGPPRASTHSDVVKLGEKPGNLQQWIDQPAVENRIKMAAVERPTIEPQLNGLRENSLELLAGCDFTSDGGVHLVIIMQHRRRAQKLH